MTLKSQPYQTDVANFQTERQTIAQTFTNVYVIVSPPRCSSTALSRIFWEHPAIQHYSHEPFETIYYQNAPVSKALENIQHPIDLSRIKHHHSSAGLNGLLIKEMPYQVGPHFPLLASLIGAPIIFLIRDPRLNIASRIEKKREKGQSTAFPLIETGWQLLQQHIGWCDANGKPYRIIDSTQFRSRPEAVLGRLFEALSLKFEMEMLNWKKSPAVPLDNLDGEHEHLYRRVLNSTHIQPPSEPIPEMDIFADIEGMTAHVETCMSIYQNLLENPCFIGD